MNLLVSQIGGLVDVLSIGETKLDSSFPDAQFHLPDFKTPYRLDVSGQTGGLLTYVRKCIPSHRLFDFKFPSDIQVIPIELNLRGKRWLLMSIYKPPSQNSKYFLDKLQEAIMFYSIYDYIIVSGDFNLEPIVPELSEFLELNSLFNHVKEKTCWKSTSGSCIDLIITNRRYCVMNTGTVETGLSDHHLLIYTMLKTKFEKLPPKIIEYRLWKFFDYNLFKNDLSHAFDCVDTYTNFEETFTRILDKHAPRKTKILRGNNQPHLTKDLRKAIMLRSKLKNMANKTGDPADVARFKKQRNLVVSLNRRAKKSYFRDSMHSAKSFWKSVKPFFDKKHGIREERILLVENGDIISDEGELSSVFNSFFKRITDKLPISEIPELLVTDLDPVSSAIAKYATHPSIMAIKSRFDSPPLFELRAIVEDEVIEEILSLNSSKSVSGSIPIKALKLAVFDCAGALTKLFNDYVIDQCSFPDELKLADIIPVHKKDSTTDKANYRPISLLPIISKVFERLISKQLTPFVNSWLSQYLCGYRKGYSTQYALLNMLLRWQSTLNSNGVVGAVLMDLSKAFDCLPHDLLIAKLAAYGFGTGSLKLFHNYLNGRKHRVRMGSLVSDFLEILNGVPQGSVLGPMLFNIFINDLLFLVREEICNLADDNTAYVCAENTSSVLCRLHNDLEIVLDWVSNNGMVANPDKFQAIFLGTRDNSIVVHARSTSVTSSKSVKLLGVTIDDQLSFYPHIMEICKKASSKTKALLRIRNYLTQKQADLLYTSYIMSPFNYCPLVWMYCSKQAHNLIRATHRKALCAKQNTFEQSYDELLLRSNSIDIHTKNLQLMVIEVFKSLIHLNPEFMWDFFTLKNTLYDLRQGSSVLVPKARTTRALNSFTFRAALAWNHLPTKLKETKNLSEFINSIKGQNIYCQCKNCIF